MKEKLRKLIAQVIAPEKADFSVDIPRVKKFGDYATNAAIILSHLSAPDLAKKIKMADREGLLASAEAAKNGFINFKLNDDFIRERIAQVRKSDKEYGRSDQGKGKKILIEFVSANPTGPLHIGHGRWAVIGDDIASLLQAVGYKVEREFYVNDVGNQVEKLEASVRARAEGKEIPEGGYGGSYVSDLAVKLKKDLSKPTFRNVLLNTILEDQKRVLRELGITYDRFFSEKDLHDNGQVCRTVEELRRAGVTLVEDGALWFKSQDFGDDKNRVLIKESGETTYFSADIAYHKDKFERGYDRLIDVWGADHHGYVPRLKAALKALGLPVEKFEVIIGQLVALFRGKEPVRMSKRTGEMITLEEVIQEIGKDATRIFMTMVTVTSHLEFDLELAKQAAPANPVYYLQYAHARISSIFREGDERGMRLEKDPDLSGLTHPAERELMLKLIELPDIIITASNRMEPHILVEYAKETAAIFHNYYHKCRVLSEDKDLSQARLALVDATRIVIRNVLELLNVSAPERM